MIEERDLSAVGKFQKTHALKGELNAILDIDPEFFEEGNPAIVSVEGLFVPFFANGVRPKGTTSYLIKLEGVNTEEDAKPFVNKTIYALRSELTSYLDLEEGDILDEEDLVGFTVLDNETGNILGIIESVDSSTANLLFIVKSPDGDELFVPAAEELIESVDENEKKILMKLPEGLIDLN